MSAYTKHIYMWKRNPLLSGRPPPAQEGFIQLESATNRNEYFFIEFFSKSRRIYDAYDAGSFPAPFRFFSFLLVSSMAAASFVLYIRRDRPMYATKWNFFRKAFPYWCVYIHIELLSTLLCPDKEQIIAEF